MVFDDVTKQAIIEIQEEYKIKGIEISIQEIGEIVKSQFIAGNFAFKKGLDLRLPKFGTFTMKAGIENGKAAKVLKDLKDTFTDKEYEQKVLEAKLFNKEKSKRRRKELEVLDFSKLKSVKNIVNVKHIYDKLL